MFSKKITQKNTEQQSDNQRAFTLLFSVLVSALVLAVGASVVLLAMKQVILSGVGRDSQFAFYASNTGIECALYWDFSKSIGDGKIVFATSTESDISTEGAECIGIDIADEISDSPGYNPELNEFYGISDDDDDIATTNFRLIFEDPVGPGAGTVIPYCADVSVTKEQIYISAEDRTRIQTTIISRGYNTCDETNTRRIERGLELTY